MVPTITRLELEGLFRHVVETAASLREKAGRSERLHSWIRAADAELQALEFELGAVVERLAFLASDLDPDDTTCGDPRVDLRDEALAERADLEVRRSAALIALADGIRERDELVELRNRLLERLVEDVERFLEALTQDGSPMSRRLAIEAVGSTLQSTGLSHAEMARLVPEIRGVFEALDEQAVRVDQGWSLLDHLVIAEWKTLIVAVRQAEERVGRHSRRVLNVDARMAAVEGELGVLERDQARSDDLRGLAGEACHGLLLLIGLLLFWLLSNPPVPWVPGGGESNALWLGVVGVMGLVLLWNAASVHGRAWNRTESLAELRQSLDGLERESRGLDGLRQELAADRQQLQANQARLAEIEAQFPELSGAGFLVVG